MSHTNLLRQRLANLSKRAAKSKPKDDNVVFPFQTTVDAITSVLGYLQTLPEDSLPSLGGMIAACEIQLDSLAKARKQWVKLTEFDTRARQSIWSYGNEILLPQVEDMSVKGELSRRLNKV